MAGLRWGMSREQVMDSFRKQIEAKFTDSLKNVNGAIEEDRLRREMDAEVTRLTKGIVEFDGRTTGWDVSFLRNEYQHRQGQSMLVVHDDNSQNFYFFTDNKLYKWYKAFNASVFAGKSFDEFARSVTSRFGKGSQRKEVPKDAHEETRQWLEWQDNTTRLRAIDQTKFYGFYSLVFDDKKTSEVLAKRAAESGNTGNKRSVVDAKGLVDAVTDTGGDKDKDPDEKVVDHLTGRYRESGSEGKKK